MAAAVELATGYVTLTVETSQVSKAIGKAFNAGETIAVSTGQKMGKALSDGLKKIETTGLDKLQAELKDAGDKAEAAAAKVKTSEERLAATVEQASRKRADARRQVEIAEQRLRELQEKGTASASQLMTAEDKVTRARQKYADVSRAGIASVSAFQKEVASSKEAFSKAEAGVDEARNALKKFEADAKAAAAETEQTGNRFSRAFSGVKQKISASFNGAFDSAKAEAKEAGDAMEREFKDAGKKSGGGFKESFKGAFAGLAAYVGVQEVIGGFKNAIMGAGDLEQSVGAVDTVFKENSASIHKWAREASTNLGLSANSYNEFATLIGSQLKNAGTPMEELGGKTNDLIALGADLASMYGGTTAEAVEALSSALKGEMDPIEKYGISLNDAALTAKGLEMGIEKSNGAFTDQQKKLITQALLFQQSADAQGNFAREADTFQGKLQRASAQWENISAKIGELFLPALTGAMGFIGNFALPAIEEFVGGIRAFRDEWVNSDGVISASGFPGVMEALASGLRTAFDWLVATSPMWGPFAAGIGLVVGAYWAWNAASIALTATKTALAAAIAAVNWPLTLIIAGIGLLVGAVIWAYNNIGWFRDLVQTAWTQIQVAIGYVVDWWTSTAWPAIQTGLQILGQWFTWLWQSVIVPAWAAIVQIIQDAWATYIQPALAAVWSFIQGTLAPIFIWLWQTIISPAFNAIVAIIKWAWETIIVPLFHFVVDIVKNVLAPIFTWLWNNIITPVWNGIVLAIKIAWAAIEIIFGLINGFLKNILGPAFKWFWDHVIKPVWTWISDAIGKAGSFIAETVFPKIQGALDVLRDAFEKTKEGIGKIWDGLKEVVKAPIKFVVGTVINDGMIAGYNKLNDFWNGKDIAPITLGFKVGGYTGDGPADEVAGLVHKGEFVLPKTATQALIRDKGMGYLESLRHYAGHPGGGAAAGPASHCKHCAQAAGAAVGHSTSASTAGAPPSGSSGIWGGFQAQIAKAGRVYVPKMNFMGVNTENVAKAWMGRSAVQIIAGSGSPGISFHQGGQGTWGFNAGSNIWMQPGVPQNMRQAVLIHELGHALSLHHTMSTGSIMHPIMRGPTWPSSLDYGSLVRAWGKPGEGVKTYSGGDGGGFDLLGALAEKLVSPVKNLFSTAREKHAGNGFVDMPLGIGEKMLDSLVEWVKNRGGDDGAALGLTPTLYDRGGLLRQGVQLIDHQRKTPDYVLTDTQWDAMYKIAENSVANNQQVIVNVDGRGIADDVLGRRIGEATAWHLNKAAGGIFV
ncbi:hypothetical protein [Rothia nasimurium]|uniref:hypothetical protein n=1 Tax=Rothia nasimurium TaxID=85336 RepID=UPI001F2E7E59|nr:hypothetical protein [Rothia nasimurium]